LRSIILKQLILWLPTLHDPNHVTGKLISTCTCINDKCWSQSDIASVCFMIRCTNKMHSKNNLFGYKTWSIYNYIHNLMCNAYYCIPRGLLSVTYYIIQYKGIKFVWCSITDECLLLSTSRWSNFNHECRMDTIMHQ